MLSESAKISRRRPRHKQGTDFCPNEMIWAARAKVGERLSIVGVYKVEHLGAIVEVTNHALLARHSPTQKWEEIDSKLTRAVQDVVPRPAENSVSFFLDVLLDKLTELIDHRQSVHVAFALSFTPGEETMTAKHNSVAAGIVIYRRA